MTDKYRNKSGNFYRADDKGVRTLVAGRGEICEPTEDELLRHAHRFEPVGPASTRNRHRGDKGAAPSGVAPVAAPDADTENEAPETPADPEHVEADAEEGVDPSDLSQYATGGGWYVMPGGDRIHGKRDAQAWLDEHLKADGGQD